MARFFPFPVLPLVLITFSSLSAPVQTPQRRCGFAADRQLVEKEKGEVPVLLKQAALDVHGRGIFLSQRRRSEKRYTEGAGVACQEAQAYARRVLDRLIRGAGLEIFAGEDPAVLLKLDCGRTEALPVATALAGRMLVVPSGLLVRAETEDALAAVLAHELAHLTLRHTERFIEASFDGSRAPAAAGSMRFRPAGRWVTEMKRRHEREADITGLRILVDGGYDPAAAVDHLRALKRLTEKLFPGREPAHRDHDSPEERIGLLESQISACGYSPVPRTVLVPGVWRKGLLTGRTGRPRPQSKIPLSSHSYQSGPGSR